MQHISADVHYVGRSYPASTSRRRPPDRCHDLRSFPGYEGQNPRHAGQHQPLGDPQTQHFQGFRTADSSSMRKFARTFASRTIRARNPLIADQVAANYRKADITPRQRAMRDFAMKVAQQAEAVDEADSAVLREHGFSNDDIWDIAAIAAFFGMSNRLANFASLRPNDEFYALGRS